MWIQPTTTLSDSTKHLSSLNSLWLVVLLHLQLNTKTRKLVPQLQINIIMLQLMKSSIILLIDSYKSICWQYEKHDVVISTIWNIFYSLTWFLNELRNVKISSFGILFWNREYVSKSNVPISCHERFIVVTLSTRRLPK